MQIDLSQFKQTYINECYELLEVMEQNLLSLDGKKADKEELNAIFRCAHSIKGGAGVFGFDYITNFTHILETMLDVLREGKIAPSRYVIDVLLKAQDVVKQMINAVQAGTSPPTGLGDDLAKELEEMAKNPSRRIVMPVKKKEVPEANNASIITSSFNILFTPNHSLFLKGNEPLLLFRELKKLGKITVTADSSKLPELSKINPEYCYLSWKIILEAKCKIDDIRAVFEFVEGECKLEIEESGNHDPDRPKEEYIIDNVLPEMVEIKPATSNTIRVDVDKVDKLVNMIGEVVIAQAMLEAEARYLPRDQHGGLLREIEELSINTRELQEAVMAIRMQAVKSVFSRMPRIIRDISKQLGKDIRLEMSGENTEIDKTIIEQLGDPLTHMIRNSVDHGIESPEDRVLKGKPAQGYIKLSASHRGGKIIIEISDDGAGINREKVLNKAREKGLVPHDNHLTNEQIDQLIFLPGFSTTEKVSNISGRGVGMDVVKQNIEALGGSVHINNNPGYGSSFTVLLPLTLAILDGMIVRVGQENYIIPIANIIETIRPKPGEVKRVAGANDLINVRGEFVSILYLSTLFSIADAVSDPSRALVVLVESGKEKFGIVVDEIIGQQQVVIKSLEKNSCPIDGIYAATILGNGKVSLILDISKLYNLMSALSISKHGEVV